jgi:hypothetical protein
MSTTSWCLLTAVGVSLPWMVACWLLLGRLDAYRETDRIGGCLTGPTDRLAACGAELRRVRQQVRDGDAVISELYAQIARLSCALVRALAKDEAA